MPIRKPKPDVKKKTTKVHGSFNSISSRQTQDKMPAGEVAPYEYAPGGRERLISGIAKNKAKAAKDAKNPVKKVIKKVKGVLPKTTVSEYHGDVENRTKYASTPIKDKKGKLKGFKPGQSREDYVKGEKAAGRTVTGRVETKKGWGTKGKTKMKIIE